MPNNSQNQPMAQGQNTYIQPIPKNPKKVSVATKIKVILIIIVALSIVLGGLFVALNRNQPSPTQPAGGPVTLTFWGRSIEADVMDEIIRDFEVENPLIKVRYERQLESNYKDRLFSRLEIKNIGALPDVAEIEEVWLDEFSSFLSPITNSEIPSRYAQQARENNSVWVPDPVSKTMVSRLYGAPFRFDSLVIAYNKGHIADYVSQQKINGIDFSSLDWSSLKERAKSLTKTRVIKNPRGEETTELIRGGISLGSPTTVTNADKVLQLLLIQNNANIYDTTTKRFVLDSKFDEIMRFYTDFTLGEKVWDNTLGNDIAAFSQGRVSMILVQAEDIDAIEKLNPSLDFVTALPAHIGSIQNISLSRTLVTPAIRANKVEANKFMEYLTRPEIGTKLHKAKNRNTFIPAQSQSLKDIPQNSPFSIFSTVNPSAKKFMSPVYENVSEEMEMFLEQSYQTNMTAAGGQKLNTFEYRSKTLEDSLNKIKIPEIKV